MAPTRPPPAGPFAPVMDRPVTQTFPAEPAREPVPSGAPRVGQPPAMGWFILAILGVGFLLLLQGSGNPLVGFGGTSNTRRAIRDPDSPGGVSPLIADTD